MKRIYLNPAPVIALIFSVVLFFISCNGNDESSSTTISNTVDSAELKLKNGKYLAYHVCRCMVCHSQRDFSKFSGPVVSGTEGMGGYEFDKTYNVPGVIYARNITPDTVNGIGKWSDEEIARAITRGINKDGDTLYTIMPYAHFNQMSEFDIYSIIAFLHTLKSNNNKVPPRKLQVALSAVYPHLQSASPDNNVKPDVMEMVKYGGYMVNAAACADCHTPMEKGKYIADKSFAGGYYFDKGTFKVNSANITTDSATGIGSWSEAMFLDKFKNYRDPAIYSSNPGKLNSEMPWSVFANMDDFDIKAIYRYLRTIPAVKNKVEKYPN